MRILDKYIILNILKISFFAILIFALLLAAVELFSKMDRIMSNDIPIMDLMEYILLSIPEYLLLVASISLLFATTYFLSTLTANNERIALLNAGISKWRLSLPIIVLSIILTFLGFMYQDRFLNRIISKHDEVEVELFGLSSTRDTRNIALKDDNGFVIYATRFNEDRNEIYNPILIFSDAEGIKLKVEGVRAIYNDGIWVFHSARVYQIDDMGVVSSFQATYVADGFSIEPNLFKSQNTSIETMDSASARRYLSRLRIVDPISWHEKATDYYRTRFQAVAIFVLMFISAAMNYRFKKNILLFSIIQSLSIAIAYYCADMVFSIAAHQGAIHPYSSVILPLVVTVAAAYIISLLGKRI